MVPRSLVRVACRLIGGMALASLAGTAEVHATSCSRPVVTGGDLCRQYPKSKVVFSGRVLERQHDGNYRLWVDRAWRGVEARSEVVVNPGSSGPCAPHALRRGARVIVFADRAKGGRLTLSREGIYSWEVASEEGAAAVRFMDSLNHPARGGTIDGAVDVKTAGQSSELQLPVAGAVVSADGNRSRVTATTDEHGQYELTGLSPGTYWVRVEMPPGLPPAHADRSQSAARAGEPGAEEATSLAAIVEVRHPRACVWAPFTGAFDGEISGALEHADGSPAAGIWMKLRPVADDHRPEYASEAWVNTDAAGRFRVTALAPWAYQVGASFNDVVTDSEPFGLSMYGGSRDSSPIAVSMGESLDLGTLRLPPRVPKRQIHGSVESPAAVNGGSLRVYARDGSSVVRSLQVRPDGSFTLDLFEGRTYQIEAIHLTWPIDEIATRGIPRQLAAGSVELTVRGDSSRLRIPLQPADR